MTRIKLVQWVGFLGLCLVGGEGVGQEKNLEALKSQESKGAHGFLKVGPAERVFVLKDRLSLGEPIMPTELKEYAPLKARLDLLRNNKYFIKLVGLLEKQTKGILPTWHVNDVELRKIEDPDEKTSPLIITYKRMQVADNNGDRVLIAREPWNMMVENPEDKGIDRTMTIAHEMFRLAVGIRCKQDGRDIEGLVGVLFNPALEKWLEMWPEDVARQMRSYVRDESSELYQVLDSAFVMQQLPAPEGWTDESTTENGKSLASCRRASDQCVYRDLKTQLYWTELNPNKTGDGARSGVTQPELATACSELGKWGGFDDWRVPSKYEYLEAATNKFKLLSGSHTAPSFFGPANVLVWTNETVTKERGTVINADTGTPSTKDADVSAPFHCVRGDFQTFWKDLSFRDAKYVSCDEFGATCIIEEKATGLWWTSRNPATTVKDTKLDGKEAHYFCKSLSIKYAGKDSGWRVPQEDEWKGAFQRDIFRMMQRYSPMSEPVSATLSSFDYDSQRENRANPEKKIVERYHDSLPFHCVWGGRICKKSEDQDCDGVKNEFDRCYGTERGARVYTTKNNNFWCGCAEGQRPADGSQLPKECPFEQYQGSPKPIE